MRRLGAADQAVCVVADLLRRAHRQPLGADDRQRERVQRGEGFTHRGRGAEAGGEVRGVDAVAREEVDDDDPGIAEARLAEELGRAEGEEAAHAGGQRAQRADLGGEFADRFRRRRRTDDDPAAVVEIGHRGVVATGQTLGQEARPDDADPGQSGRHGRG